MFKCIQCDEFPGSRKIVDLLLNLRFDKGCQKPNLSYNLNPPREPAIIVPVADGPAGFTAQGVFRSCFIISVLRSSVPGKATYFE